MTENEHAPLPNDDVMERLKNLTPEEADRFMEAAGLTDAAIGKTVSLEDLFKEIDGNPG